MGRWGLHLPFVPSAERRSVWLTNQFDATGSPLAVRSWQCAVGSAQLAVRRSQFAVPPFGVWHQQLTA